MAGEKKKMSASDIAFIVFIIILLICVVAMIIMTIGMSKGWWDSKLSRIGTRVGMVGETHATVKPGVTIGFSAATVASIIAIIIIYVTKKQKKTESYY